MAHAKRVGTAVAAVLALTLSLAACGGDDNKGGGGTGTDTGAKGGTLTVYHANDVEHLDPTRNFVTDSGAIGQLIFRRLMAYKYDAKNNKTELVPDLAKDFSASADAKEWTFHLKDNLKYEDGSPILAKDIKLTAERSFSADLKEGAPYAVNFLACPTYKGPYVAGNNGGKGCEAITTPDDKTIVFKLKEAVPEFNHVATMNIFAPTPAAKDTKTQYDNHVFSSGPYKIETYTRKKTLVLVRNTNWDASTDDVRKALPDKVIFKFGDSPTVVDQRLIASGAADASSISFSAIDPSNLGKLNAGNVKPRVVKGTDVCRRYIGFNEQKKLLQDQNLREALLLGMDKKAYILARGGDQLNVAVDSIVPEDLEGYRPDSTWKAPLEGDVAKAKAALGKSTYKGEKLVLGISDATPITIKAGEAAQAAWKRVGINVDLKKIPADNYYSTQQNDASATDLITAGWCQDWASISSVVAPVLGKDPTTGKPAQNNYSRSQAEWATIDTALKNTDLKAAAQQFADALDAAMKTAPLVPISKDQNVYVVGSNVVNAAVDPGAGGLIDLNTVGLKKAN